MSAPRPPSPPRRKSSRHSRILKLYSRSYTRLIDSSHAAPSKPRHEQCFAHADAASSGIRSLRERFCSSLERHRRGREQSHAPAIARTSSSSPVGAARTTRVLSGAFGKRKSDPCLSQTRSDAGKRTFSFYSGARTQVCSSAARVEKLPPVRVPVSRQVPVIKEGPRSAERGPIATRSSEFLSRREKPRLTKKEQEQSCRRLSRSADLSSPVEIRKALQKQKEKEARDAQTKSPLTAPGRQKRPADKSLKVPALRGPESSRKTSEQQPAARKPSSAAQPKTSATKIAARTIPPEPKKSRIVAKPSERLVVSRESLRSASPSCSEMNGDASKRGRPRDKPQTIVKATPTRRPETIRIGADGGRKKPEKDAKRKARKDQDGGGSDEADTSEWREIAENEEIKLLRRVERTVSSVGQEKARTASSLTVEQIKRHREATRTDSFFQNLFLRDRSLPGVAAADDEEPHARRSLVGERAKMFQDVARDGFRRSEPSLKSLSVYLAHKRPVSNSKFKSWERESVASSRSSSPHGVVCWPGRSVLRKVGRFDSLLGIDEFGSSATLRARSPEPGSRGEHAKERSLSEPPLKTLPESRESSPRSSSPARSQARYRTQTRDPDDTSDAPRKARARSAGEAEEPKKSGSSLSLKSTGSLSSIDREDYQQYILELLHHRRRSKRYEDLRDFYASLSRMDQLERAAFSSSDLRPRLRNEEIIDYDRWKRVRSRERAERELSTLYGKLRSVQRDKDLLFSARDVDKFRWRGDCGLRCKERSVEDILQHFRRLQSEESGESRKPPSATLPHRDTYKPLWRGSSVVNVATTMQRRANADRNAADYHPSLQRSLGGSKKFWSSLSIEQVTSLKKQLNEIYGSDGPQRSTAQRPNVPEVETRRNGDDETIKDEEILASYEIVVPPEDGTSGGRLQDDSRSLHVRCHSMIATNESGATRIDGAMKKSDSIGRLKSAERESDSEKQPVSPPMSEQEKKRLSLTLGREALDRITRRRISPAPLAPRETRGSIAAALAKVPTKPARTSDTLSVASTSPRTCYSLEASYIDDSAKSKDKSDFLLVLTTSNESPGDKRRVETVLEEWSKKPALLAMAAPEGVATPDSMTESSETASVRTVIQRNGGPEAEDVSRKIEFFEKRVDQQQQQQQQQFTFHRKKLSSSQSFADLKELFGESASARYSVLDRSRSTSPRGKTSAIGDERKESDSPTAGTATLSEAAGTRQQQPFRSCSQERERDTRPPSVSPCRATTRSNSSCSVDSGGGRPRSLSPDPERYWRAYLRLARHGTVRRLRARFESAEDLPRRVRLARPKRFRSDPELARSLLRRASENGGEDAARTRVDVAWLRGKFEGGAARRGRTRGPRFSRGESPPVPRVPLRRENLSMPRIDVISKTVELKEPQATSTVTNHAARRAETRELAASEPVRRMRKRFESPDAGAGRTSLMGEMFTSAPDVRELRDIAPYLAGKWVAHRYPSRRDNMRSLSSPADLEIHRGPAKTADSSSPSRSPGSRRKAERPRATSSSPTRPPRTPASILKPSSTQASSIFAGQPFDPDKHRPRFRYQPPPPPPVSPVAARKHHRTWWPTLPVYTARPTVTFEGLKSHQLLEHLGRIGSGI